MRSTRFLGALVATLGVASSAGAAQAAIPTVFSTSAAPVTCDTQPAGAVAGQRFCTGAIQSPAPVPSTYPSTVPSFDGTPIDVAVTLPPAPASGPDGNFPVIGVYHGYGGYKQQRTDSEVQRWVSLGYAVFSMTDRGFWYSCGAAVPVKPPSCDNGYIHLMSNAYEVHDAQYFLGLLADEGAIDPTRIGATGGSYGGGISLQLGALKNRVQQPDGSLVPWKSPGGLAMSIAATAPRYGWSDLAASLMPNGSTLDYAAENPYTGPAGDRRFGIQKLAYNQQLYIGGSMAGWYTSSTTDPTSNINSWNTFNSTGGPYDGQALATEQITELPNHSGLYTNQDEAPAPALISNGWNDDLFPVNEAVRYYNRVRSLHPETPIQMFHLSFGHTQRSGTVVAADAIPLVASEQEWFDRYVRRTGVEPTNPRGGVGIVTSACAGTAPAAGAYHRAKNWASLAPGEIRMTGAAAQTVSPTTAPAAEFNGASATVCTEAPSTDTAGAAVYSTAPTPAGGFTLAGSPTVVADLTVANANDALLARLYDVDPAAGTEKMIARGVYRPTGAGTSRQVFQLFPQAYTVAAGHQVKLELLGQDATGSNPYARPATGQAAVDVANLELRLPTLEDAGALGGYVQTPAAKLLPAGYALARDAGPQEVVQPEPVPAAAGGSAAVVTPKPTLIDPLSKADALAILKQAPRRAKLTAGFGKLSFSADAPEPGTLTYRASIRVRIGGRLRTVVLGTAKRTAKHAAPARITIRIGTTGRAQLRLHRTAKITLRTQFVTKVARDKLTASRTLKVGRPRR